MPFDEVKVDEWNDVGKAKVFYSSKSNLSLYGIFKLIRNTPHYLIYLNSFLTLDLAYSL